MPLGRPTDYSPGLAATICERIADGESLRSICQDEAMPKKAQVFVWLGANPAFADQYARAREAQADSFADDLTGIADNSELDPNDRRIRIDARKWLAGKMRPKKYGDRVQLTGADGGAIRTVDEAALAKLSPDELDNLIAIQRKLYPSDPSGAPEGEGETGTGGAAG